MWKNKIIVGCIILFFLAPIVPSQAKAGFGIQSMKVEYESNPLGVETQHPRFSWQLSTPEKVRAIYQQAFRLVVTDEKKHEVWDSGKRKSEISLNIPYGGMALKPQTKYLWRLEVWTNNKKHLVRNSSFETGLMDSNETAWGDAQWIGGDAESRPFYAPYFNVFRLQFSIQLDKTSTRAGFVYGVNEERLADASKNLFHLKRGKDESYYELELDISSIKEGKGALLHLYRVGYHPDDRADVPKKTIEIPKEIINKENVYAEHKFMVVSVNGTTSARIDDSPEIWLENVNPIGVGGDVISFPSVCDIGYKLKPNQKAKFGVVEVKNYRSPENILVHFDGVGWLEGGTQGLMKTFDPSRNSMPMLRTEFQTAKDKIVSARIYATARGIYDLYLNGKRVTDSYFNPGLTQYNKTQHYQIFDVTDLLKKGENALGAILGEGWWSGGISYTAENWNMFGDCQSLKLMLKVRYQDGREQTVVSNTRDWKYSVEGPIVYGSFFHGEVYDAQREKSFEGWSQPNFNDSAWKPVQEVSLKGNIATTGIQSDFSQQHFIAQMGQPVTAGESFPATGMKEVKPQLYVYDMGQNTAGVPMIHFSGLRPGQKIYLRFSEVTYPDLPAYEGNVGMVMLENIRSARAQDIYIAKGGEEDFSPRQTFHGFRYMEISGLDAPLPLENVKTLPLSSINELTSDYESSNSKVNRLWKNILWSARSNFLSIPTDCPQRNERMGWNGDISVFSRTATLLSSVPGFLRKHLQAIRDLQASNGEFPDVAPVGGGFGGFLWESAGITVAWETFLQYADTVAIREHYPAMKRYIKYVQEKYIDPVSGLLVQKREGGDLGDWLALEYDKDDKSLLWECYYIYDLQLLSRMARALGAVEDAKDFAEMAEKRRTFFRQNYIEPQSLKTVVSDFLPEKKGQLVDMQTSYVLPLAFYVLSEKEEPQLMKNLEGTIVRNHKLSTGREVPPYSLMTGFIGTSWINRVLSEGGRSDLSYRLLQQTSYPSWLYSVEQGATTIWERLNSYTIEDGFGGNNSMNSFNHYSFGAVGSWMLNYSLGIESDPDCPGLQHFLLHPEVDPTGQMTYAKGFLDSPYGRIESSWRVSSDRVCYEFTVPANTSADLTLPAAFSKTSESGSPLQQKGNGYEWLKEKDGKIYLRLHSGHYEFVTIQ